MRFPPFVQRAWETMRRHAMTSRGDRILIAVSGGVDSMVLWRILTLMAPANDWSLFLGHVDHDLREDSAATAEWLSREAQVRGVSFRSTRLDGESLRRDPFGLEAAARREREAALDLMAEELGATRVATAHHLDDQAETVLERLTRGAGRAGLAGIRPVRGAWIRPLIECGRAGIVAYAREEGLEWREDGSNADRRFFRNVLRHDVLPVLRTARPGCERVLARAAEVARVEDAVLDEIYREERARRVRGDGDSGCFDVSGLSARSEEYRVWLAWRLLAEIGGARRARADGIALAGLFADTAVGRSIDVGGGAFAARTRVGVEWRRSPAEPLVESPLAVPGVLTLSGGNRLVTRWGDPADDGLRGPTVGLLDAERVVGSLFVRPRRAGDRVRRPGGLGSKTLADCWSEAGVAADRREALPVVCDEGGVVWAPWAGPDERVSGLAQGGGRLVLDYQEIRYTDR